MKSNFLGHKETPLLCYGSAHVGEDVKREIARATEEVVLASQFLIKEESHLFLEQVARLLASCFQNHKKVLIAGNGGSLCDAMHFAEELTGQFRSYRPALAAIALSDPSHLSCVANDFGFEEVFARSVEALGQPGDVLVLLTTSGNSINLIKAAAVAKKKGMHTVALLGKTGGGLLNQCDLQWVVSGFRFSDRIQEIHMAALHIIVELIESLLFNEESTLSTVSPDSKKSIGDLGRSLCAGNIKN